MLIRFVLFIILFICLTNASTVGYRQSTITSYNLMGTSGNSKLYNLTLSNDPYEYPIYFIDNLFASADIPKFLVPTLERIIGDLLDWQWDNWLSKQVTSELMEELNGIEQGGNAVGIKNVGSYITRTITLANLPSDLNDMKYIF